MVVNNPNNWHWVDKNCIDWTRQYFKENLVGLRVSKDSTTAEINSITSVEGDVVVSQRKGKVISLFDLKLVLGYTGKVEDVDVKGSITIPEVAYDTEEDEYQFEISVFSENNDNVKVKEVIRKELVPELRKKLGKFSSDLLSTHGSDIQLPSEQVKSQFTKANQESSTIARKEELKAKTSTNAPSSTTGAASSELSSSSIPAYNSSTLHFEPVFNTTAEQLYVTFLEKNRIGAWTRSNPDFSGDLLKEGSSFKLFGGNIEGEITKLVPNSKIEQKWRLKSWKANYYANLTIDIHQGESETKLNVLFKGIPIGEEDVVQGNFEDYYVRSIKLTFGFGAVL